MERERTTKSMSPCGRYSFVSWLPKERTSASGHSAHSACWSNSMTMTRASCSSGVGHTQSAYVRTSSFSLCQRMTVDAHISATLRHLCQGTCDAHGVLRAAACARTEVSTSTCFSFSDETSPSSQSKPIKSSPSSAVGVLASRGIARKWLREKILPDDPVVTPISCRTATRVDERRAG